MKALVRYGSGEDDVELRDMPEPSPAPGQVKIEVNAVGICGTDIHQHPSLQPPVILGHELSGVIVEVGSAVKKRKVGERVTSETTYHICGRCRFCLSGDYNLCLERKGIATKANGAFAKYMVNREESIHALPKHVSFSAGALCEPLACATHAVMEQADVSSGETVVVVGPGPIGLLVAQVAIAVGAKVILGGTTADEERFILSKRFGVARTVDVQKEEIVEVVKAVTEGYGADVVFECTGVAPAVRTALACLRARGRYVQIGILHKEIALDFDNLFFDRELMLLGHRTSRPSSWVKALQLLEGKKVDLQSLINKKLPLSSWKEGFQLVKDKKAIKVILKP